MNNPPNPNDIMAGFEAMMAGMAVFYGILVLIGLAMTVFWIIELVDVARREFRDQNTKVLWLLVVLLSHGVGSLIYYFVGRPQGWLPGEEPKYAPQYPPQDPYGYPPPPAYYPPPAPPENRQE